MGDNWSRGYKNDFMLNSVEHEVFQLINVKMQTIIGILPFSRKNSILGFFLSLKMLDFLIFLYLRAFKMPCSTGLSMRNVL